MDVEAAPSLHVEDLDEDAPPPESTVAFHERAGSPAAKRQRMHPPVPEVVVQEQIGTAGCEDEEPVFAFAVEKPLVLNTELRLLRAVRALRGGIAPATTPAQRSLNLGDTLLWPRQPTASGGHG